MFSVLLRIASFLVGPHTIRALYRDVVLGEKSSLGLPGYMLKLLVLPARKTRWFGKHVRKITSVLREEPVSYSKARIDLEMNSIMNLPEVVVSSSRPRTINVLVPAFSIKTMSAGFFGVFQVALMIARQGLNVRLVLFDNFYFDKDVFRTNLQKYPGLQTLLDEVELDYIGDRYLPLKISPLDSAVATVWYSAYFARKIMAKTGGGAFLYLIQDYEAAFHPFNSSYILADTTYSFEYYALVSTKPLYEFMKSRSSQFAQLCTEGKSVYFNNACSATLPDKSKFMDIHRGKTKRLAFYSRPAVNRNMFELGARALIEAWEQGYFDTGHNWEFYGIGLGDVEIYLDARCKLVQLPRMSLAEYETKISEFDICLSLMASPHPSITPFDLAGVGALVVTNQFYNKGPAYFQDISANILVSQPDVFSLAQTLRLALKRVDNLEARYQAAVNMSYPRAWNEVWTCDHTSLMDSLFKAPPIQRPDLTTKTPLVEFPEHQVRTRYRSPETTAQTAE